MGDDSIVSPTETWNIGKNFSMYHVLLPFIECKRLVKICLFGVDDISEDMIPKEIKNLNKINALNRLLEELKQIIDDTNFVMDKTTKKTMEGLKKKLGDVEKVIDGISYEVIDTRTGYGSTVLFEKHYSNCLNVLRVVLSEIKSPLNIKDLIFASGGEIDLEKLKQELIESG